MSNELFNLISVAGPTLINLIAILAVIIKVIREFRNVAADLNSVKVKVNDNAELKELTELTRQVIQENYELKRTLNETLSKIDHVERK